MAEQPRHDRYFGGSIAANVKKLVANAADHGFRCETGAGEDRFYRREPDVSLTLTEPWDELPCGQPTYVVAGRHDADHDWTEIEPLVRGLVGKVAWTCVDRDEPVDD